MAEAGDALRRAAMAKLSEILRTVAAELAGPCASSAEFERALMTLAPVLAEVLQEELIKGALVAESGRKDHRSNRR